MISMNMLQGFKILSTDSETSTEKFNLEFCFMFVDFRFL